MISGAVRTGLKEIAKQSLILFCIHCDPMAAVTDLNRAEQQHEMHVHGRRKHSVCHLETGSKNVPLRFFHPIWHRHQTYESALDGLSSKADHNNRLPANQSKRPSYFDQGALALHPRSNAHCQRDCDQKTENQTGKDSSSHPEGLRR
jgi:hypothetical protein